MKIETTDNFIIVQLEDGDFKWVDEIREHIPTGKFDKRVAGWQPYKQALIKLMQQIPEADRFFDGHHKVWMITNTPEYLKIAQQIKQELERALGGGVRTPEGER